MKYFFLLFSIMTLSVLSAQAQENIKKKTTKTIEKEIVVTKKGEDEKKYIQKKKIVMKSNDNADIDRQVDSLIQTLDLNEDEAESINVEVTVSPNGTKTIVIESISEEQMEIKTKQLEREGIMEAENEFEVEIEENRVDVEPLPKTTVSLGVEINEKQKLVNVIEGGAADKAGLMQGDIIKKIDAQKIYSIHGLLEHLGSYQPGDEVEVTYERSGSNKTTKVKLDPK